MASSDKAEGKPAPRAVMRLSPRDNVAVALRPLDQRRQTFSRVGRLDLETVGGRGRDRRARGLGDGTVAGAQLRAHEVEIALANFGLRHAGQPAVQRAQRAPRHPRQLAR